MTPETALWVKGPSQFGSRPVWVRLVSDEMASELVVQQYLLLNRSRQETFNVLKRGYFRITRESVEMIVHHYWARRRVREVTLPAPIVAAPGFMTSNEGSNEAQHFAGNVPVEESAAAEPAPPLLEAPVPPPGPPRFFALDIVLVGEWRFISTEMTVAASKVRKWHVLALVHVETGFVVLGNGGYGPNFGDELVEDFFCNTENTRFNGQPFLFIHPLDIQLLRPSPGFGRFTRHFGKEGHGQFVESLSRPEQGMQLTHDSSSF